MENSIKKAMRQALEIKPCMNILDAGCGRGELAIHCAKLGAYVWGIDFSQAAIQIANESLQELGELKDKLKFLQGSLLDKFSFDKDKFDVVFLNDVVEHIPKENLALILKEVNRVLKPTGKLIIRSGPNRWYYTYGYKLYRFLSKISNEKLPLNPRSKYDYLYINEQTYSSLKSALKKANFLPRLKMVVPPSKSKNLVKRLCVTLFFIGLFYLILWGQEF